MTDITVMIAVTLVMFPSVTDLSDCHRMTKRTLANAAAAIAGMVYAGVDSEEAHRPCSRRAFSEYSGEGMFSHEPDADRLVSDVLHESLDSKIQTIEVTCHINDRPCAQAPVAALDELVYSNL